MPGRSRIRMAASYLAPSETAVPVEVRRAERFLTESGIWYRFSRNATVMSCVDAANRRNRLGHTGIPLWDELKSMAYVADGGLIIAHCRGDEHISAAALAAVLRQPNVSLADSVFLQSQDLGYGLINPFATWRDATLGVRHVFDEKLVRRVGVPGTLMTNAGDRTWAVEFYADELIAALGPGAEVAPIVTEAPKRPDWLHDGKQIGIVTGNAPESGLMLMQRTIDEVRNALGRMNLGDISMPRVQLTSVPEMGLSMELSERIEAVVEALLNTVEQLCLGGCRLIAVACNTTQYFRPELEELCRQYDAEFLPMPKVVSQWLSARNARTVGLVGIRYVSDLGEWSAYGPALANLRVEIPGNNGMRRIEEIAYQVKAEGATTQAMIRLRNVLRDVIDEEFGSEYVILALTELSMLMDLPRQGTAKGRSVLLDPLRIYGEALAHRYLGNDPTYLELPGIDRPAASVERDAINNLDG